MICMGEKNIHKVSELIKKYNCEHFYILDSNKEGFTKKDEVLYEKYYCKTKKIESGSLFLYRQPKRNSKNRKFYFFGGGIVDFVEFDGEEYIAYIREGFDFVYNIYEDDKHLNSMVWTSKEKKNGWDHFWSKYGINEINLEDMLNITKNSYYVYHDEVDVLLSQRDYNDVIVNKEASSLKHPFLNNHRKNSRLNMIEFAEQVIYDQEKEKVASYNLKEKREVKILGRVGRLNIGYDILSYDENGEELHIEVKISPSGRKDFLQVTRREMEMFKDPNYRLYRLYDIDEENNCFEIQVLTGDDLLKQYEFEPLLYRAKLKESYYD